MWPISTTELKEEVRVRFEIRNVVFHAEDGRRTFLRNVGVTAQKDCSVADI
jgi:hypothetical protein